MLARAPPLRASERAFLPLVFLALGPENVGHRMLVRAG
jgi:hypothetical protein